MGQLKDYGTDNWDDMMVREIPNIERVVHSLKYILDQASERFAPCNPYLEQLRGQYEAAVSALRRHKDIISQFRQEYPKPN